MWEILQYFLADAFDMMIEECLVFFENIFGDLLHISFFIESFPGLDETVLTSFSISKAMNALYGVLVIILTLKLLTKGWKIYVLWRDGESETPPSEMIVGAVIAIGISVAFPLLLEMGIDVVEWILNTVSKAMFADDSPYGENLISSVLEALGGLGQTSIVILILSLVYIIMLVIMFFITLKQGGEMLLFRLAVPLASIGWVDSDGGVWKPFIQALFRQIATVLVRYFFTFLAVRIITGVTIGSLIVGIAFLAIAISTPQILAQFMNTGKGGGFTQKMYTVGMVARVFMGG